MLNRKLGELFFDITAKNDKFKANMSGIKNSLKSVGVSAVAVGNMIADAVKAGVNAIVRLARVAVRNLFQVAKESVNIASAFIEARNRFKVVFGELAGEADKAARRISDAFDLTHDSAKMMMSDTADMLIGMGYTRKEAYKMSNQISILAGDVASFKDIEEGAAFTAQMLTKAMIGQTKQVRNRLKYAVRIGIESNKRIKQLRKETGMTHSAAKAQDIYNQIVKAAATAEGDYARTKHEFANRQKALNFAIEEFQIQLGGLIIKILEAADVVPKLQKEFKSLARSIEDIDVNKIQRSTVKTTKNMSIFLSAAKGIYKLIYNLFLGLPNLIFKGLADLIGKFVPKFETTFFSMSEAILKPLRKISPMFDDIVTAYENFNRKIKKINEDAANSSKTFLETLNEGKDMGGLSDTKLLDEKIAKKKELLQLDAEDMRAAMQKSISSSMNGKKDVMGGTETKEDKLQETNILMQEQNRILQMIQSGIKEQAAVGY